MPRTRHDGTPWTTEDGDCLQPAGQGWMRGVVAKVKGDRAEQVRTLGLQCWSHLFHPCFKCHASREDLAEIGDANLGSPPYAASSPADHDDACAICEIWVVIPDQRTHALLIGMLRNESKVGRRGRVLQNDFPSLGLLGGDRLEPSRYLRDIREFDRVPVGTRLLFWLAQNETLAKHRCPMCTPESHITIVTLSLSGHSPRVQPRSAQGLREGSVLGVSACRCVGHTRSYANQSHRRRHPFTAQRCLPLVRRQEGQRSGDTIYQLQDLTPPMLGSNTRPSVASKAAETRTLLECARDLVRRHAARLGSQGTALVALGDELVQMRTILRQGQRTLPREHGLEMVQCAKRAVVLRPDTGCEWHPKWHLLLHIAGDVCDKGNPQFETTFLHEHWNGKMAKAAAKCYRQTWHESLLEPFRWLQRSQRQRV